MLAIKNQTASSSYKPALLDCGIKIDVPPFIESGEKIIIDTRTLEYVKELINEIKFSSNKYYYKSLYESLKVFIRDFGEIENLQVSSKGPGDFVTSADKRTEKIIIEELQKAHPEYGIITEERGIINKANKNNRWIIDPIDGTYEFFKWSTSICNFIGYEEKK